MRTIQRILSATACVLGIALASGVRGADGPPPTGEWIPDDAIFVIDLIRPTDILDRLLDQELADRVRSLPFFGQVGATKGYQELQAVIQIVESQIGTDWRTGLRNILGGGITLAIRPDGSTILIVDAKDATVLERLQGSILGLAKAEASRRNEPDRTVSFEYKGTSAWTFGPEEAHAIIGNRLVLTNRRGALEKVLDLRAGEPGGRLAASQAYKAARAAAGPDAAASAYLNLALLKLHQPFQDGLAEARNPLASLLFTGAIEAIQASSWLSMGLRIDGAAVSLRTTVDGKAQEKGSAAFARPASPGEGALPTINVPRRIAGMTLYRDLHGFYAAKDDLFPDRTSGLIFFENMMGIFFSGMDLTEEVMAELRPEIRLVAAEQEYDPSIGTPAMRLPAFAAVFRMKHPETFGEVMEEAWQKALGLINFTRGQQALPGLVIDRPSRGGQQITVSAFRAPKAGERKDIDTRFNFRPTMARIGDALILSSSDGLTWDLAEALQREAAGTPRPIPLVNSLLELSSPQLLSILRANREGMVRQNMVEKGNAREKAESDIDILLTILEVLGPAKLSLGTQDGRPLMDLEIRLKAPGAVRQKVLRAPESNEGGARPLAAATEASHGR